MTLVKNMKIIFLDFDGVLNCRRYRENCLNYYEDYIDESRMYLLKYIVDKTGAKIVLTTTWRMYWDSSCPDGYEEAQKINNIFAKYGLEIYSKTNNYEENRDFEITMWIAENNIKQYVILDDNDFGWSKLNREHFVQTDDEKDGLDEEQVQKAIDILTFE